MGKRLLVTCEGCRCLLYLQEAQKVEQQGSVWGDSRPLSYCKRCKPPYDLIRYWSDGTKTYHRKRVDCYERVDQRGNTV